jgi:uncharacterized C2H2 Zn-finger protein
MHHINLDHVYLQELSKEGRHYICHINLDHVYLQELSN